MTVERKKFILTIFEREKKKGYPTLIKKSKTNHAK